MRLSGIEGFSHFQMCHEDHLGKAKIVSETVWAKWTSMTPWNCQRVFEAFLV